MVCESVAPRRRRNSVYVFILAITTLSSVFCIHTFRSTPSHTHTHTLYTIGNIISNALALANTIGNNFFYNGGLFLKGNIRVVRIVSFRAMRHGIKNDARG